MLMQRKPGQSALLIPSSERRVAEVAKRPVDALLRGGSATYEQLAEAWKALADTVRAERREVV